MNPTLDIPKRTGFLDFGCSNGNSVVMMEKRFSAKGIGIDIDDAKLAEARSRGVDARYFDLFEGKLEENSVDFVTMLHVLEHLYSENSVSRFLSQGLLAARSFVLIRIPFFDADGALARRGLKFYHSDWSGHKMPLSTLQMYRLIKNAVHGTPCEIFVAGRQKLSGLQKTIIPIDAPINTSKVAAEAYPGFNVDELGEPIYKELAALVVLDKAYGEGEDILKTVKISPDDIFIRRQMSDAPVSA